nr:sulfite exporter TauE/SafE family protein [Bradyrhizobium sp. AUGA SZCCT0160]
MDGNLILPFILATFLGGFVSGFSGFAMGLVVSGIWLHIITPIQTAALIAGYGLLTQGYGIAKLRHELRWQDIWPLTLGTAIGIPIGVMLLTTSIQLTCASASECCWSFTQHTALHGHP